MAILHDWFATILENDSRRATILIGRLDGNLVSLGRIIDITEGLVEVASGIYELGNPKASLDELTQTAGLSVIEVIRLSIKEDQPENN